MTAFRAKLRVRSVGPRKNFAVPGETSLLAAAIAAIALGWVTLPILAQSSNSVTLAWNPSASSNVASYHLYEGTVSEVYTNLLNAGDNTNIVVQGLVPGVTYYFAVTAYSSNGLESTYSAEVSYTVPVATNPPPVIALTAPANGANYTAPANIDLTASVTTNNQTIQQVQFYNSTSLLGTTTSAPYSFLWNNVSAGNYNLSAAVVYGSGSVVSSPAISVTVTNPPVGGLPLPWQSVNIGKGLPGTNGAGNGAFQISSSGTLGGYADNFRLVYQPLSGNGQISARINSLQDSVSGGCVGLMIRESLTPSSRYALMGYSTRGRFVWQSRSSTGGSTASGQSGSGTMPNVWALLVRNGRTFLNYKSSNGTNWTLINQNTNVMATNIYIGLAVASGRTNVLCTTTFTNLNVVP